MSDLAEALSIEPTQGTSLGNDSFKIRVPIKCKGKGKSGGARIITYLINQQKEIYLLTIYDKVEFDTIDNKTLQRIIAVISSEK